MNAGSREKEWFRSLYFKTWAVGSVVAVLYMLLVSVLSRKDPLKVSKTSADFLEIIDERMFS